MRIRRFTSIFILIGILLSMITNVFAYDTVKSEYNYIEGYNLPETYGVDDIAGSGGSLVELGTGNTVPFDYNVPDGGATVLIFFSTNCGMSMQLFSSMEDCKYLDDPRVNILALNGNDASDSEIYEFIEENTGDRYPEYMDVYHDDTFIWYDYVDLAKLYNGQNDIFWGTVVVITETDGIKNVEYAATGLRDAVNLDNTLAYILGEEPRYTPEEYGIVDCQVTRTKEEIREKWKTVSYVSHVFNEAPYITESEYRLGEISDSFNDNTLSYFNFIRYVAGVNEMDYAINEEDAQEVALSLVNDDWYRWGTNDEIGRLPGMDSDDYEELVRLRDYYILNEIEGSDKASVMMNSIYDRIKDVNSGDLANRRELLDISEYSKLYYGLAMAENGDAYTAISISNSNGYSNYDFDYVEWPAAGNHPKEFMSGDADWSVSLNLKEYEAPDDYDIHIRVTRESDGYTWDSDNGMHCYFWIDESDTYGSDKLANAIIFNPYDSYGNSENYIYDGVYSVEITGLRYKNGEPAKIEYTVDFFDLHDYTVTEHEVSGAQAGGTKYECSDCGHISWKDRVSPYGFDDVDISDYYNDSVMWALDREITSGTSDYEFSPESYCTRAQVLTMLWRVYGCPDPKYTTLSFNDVKESDYFYKAVLWAYGEGITSGVGYGNFDPHGVVTRAQFVTFLYRAFDNPRIKGENIFNDVYENTFYYNPVTWAYTNGITAGTSPDKFSPDAYCTRGQVVTFLCRAYNK